MIIEQLDPGFIHPILAVGVCRKCGLYADGTFHRGLRGAPIWAQFMKERYKA